MIKFCVTILFTSNILILLKDLKISIEVGLYLQLELRRPFGLSEYHFFFPYRPSLRFYEQVPSTLYVVCVFESSIQTYIHGAC